MAAINMNKEQFHQLMKEDKPVLVDYWAPWCGYCRRISRAYDIVAQNWADRVQVVKINIDEEAALADREKIEVIPTLVLYHGDRALGSIVAPESKAAIEDFIRRTLEQ